MSDKTLIDAIKHYQKDIERSPGNAERMLRCLKRLYVMPIKVEHLQQTGVGRSVNNLREASGEVGDAATALVAKWKAMVTAEDMVQEEESPVEEEEEDIPAEKSLTNNRVSPDNDHSVKDKENIRLNHRNDKVKNDSSEKTEKSDKSYKRSEKETKDNKSSKHSSKDRESSSRKDSSSKNHVSSKESSRDKDKKDKDRSSEKHKESTKSEHKGSSEKHKESSKSEHKSSSERNKESSKSEHKSSSEKDKKLREDRDKNHSKDKDKHSSRDKEVSKEKDRKHSSSSSKDKHKDKVSSSRDRESSKKDKSSDRSKDRSRDRSRDRKEKNSKKESKRSRSHEKEEESRKSGKRKHRDKEREDEKSNKRLKRERSSSDEEDESDAGSNESSSRVSGSDNENNHSSGDERSDHSEEGSQSESEDVSESESYSKVRIKQEPMSDSESEETSPLKKSSHKDSNQRSSSSSKSSKHKSNEDMRPPKTNDLKALIKENEKKIKKEKVEDGKNEKTKKSKAKLELNQDGSIDSGSGASFADALMGFDKPSSGSPKKKKKKEEGKTKDINSRLSVSSLAASSVSGHSRSPSQCSTSSYRSTSSPVKQERKSTVQDIRETPAALLMKPVKLEPLSLDISSTLPEISTNYKPLPSIQSRHTPTQVMSEEQMFNIMTSKNQRTKVYSGYKYGQIMAVPSLYTFCIQVLYDNIDCLEYTGGVPYEILKPLLIKLNAEQLSSLEHFNPYLVIDTDDLWKFHCKKTFPRAHRDDMESWREVYLRCMDERELKLKKLTANITENMATKGPKRQAKLAYVDSVVKPPRNVARQQVKYGTGTGSSSPAASTSSSSVSQTAAVQNQAKKKEIVSKAVVGGFTPAAMATEQVPGFSNPSAAAKILKKKKAPLMAKALQLIKGNRFKR